jgi:tocopherol cyclase
MRRWLQTRLHPAWYQGYRARPPYFEGWYFKLIDSTEQHRYAIIPGIFLGQGDSHAFVQLLDGVTGETTYNEYPAETFQAAEDRFDVRVGPNRFTLEQIELQIDSAERAVAGALRFAGLTPWPVTLLSPGVMGWYAWVPRMECYHGVLSFGHEIQGALTVDGRAIDFSAGRGYIEKDWGRSFPAAWVWMQTNHFERPGTSLTASIAIIPWMGSSFLGFIVGLWHGGTLYRFATYTGARVEKLTVEESHADLVVRDRRYRLEIDARRDRTMRTGVLRGPTGLDMGGRVPESLQAIVDVRLSRVTDGQIIFEETGRNAGLEIVGELQ